MCKYSLIIPDAEPPKVKPHFFTTRGGKCLCQPTRFWQKGEWTTNPSSVKVQRTCLHRKGKLLSQSYHVVKNDFDNMSVDCHTLTFEFYNRLTSTLPGPLSSGSHGHLIWTTVKSMLVCPEQGVLHEHLVSQCGAHTCDTKTSDISLVLMDISDSIAEPCRLAFLEGRFQ